METGAATAAGGADGDKAMTDARKGGVWGDHTRAGQPWTDQEDEQLIAWGLAVGHDFVAGHDFGREPREGTERIAWLREHRASLVKHVEAETMSEPDEEEPPDMRRKENRRLVH